MLYTCFVGFSLAPSAFIDCIQSSQADRHSRNPWRRTHPPWKQQKAAKNSLFSASGIRAAKPAFRCHACRVSPSRHSESPLHCGIFSQSCRIQSCPQTLLSAAGCPQILLYCFETGAFPQADFPTDIPDTPHSTSLRFYRAPKRQSNCKAEQDGIYVSLSYVFKLIFPAIAFLASLTSIQI